MSVVDLQAIKKKIAGLKKAAQRNTCQSRWSESEPGYKRAQKRLNLKSKASDKYWGENYQKLDAFIQQGEQNFWIDGFIRDKTRVAYAGPYCRGTFQMQLGEDERRPDHCHLNVVSWDDMKKELRRQLVEENVYIDEMYDKWQRAAQRTNQTGKEFGAYLQSILLNLDGADAPNETEHIQRMQQRLRSEICTALYQKLTVRKDWPIFLEAVAKAESSIHLEYQ